MQQSIPLIRGQSVEAPNRGVELPRGALEQTHKTPSERLYGLPVKQIRTVVEAQLQALAWECHQTQGIMCGIVSADVGQAQARSPQPPRTVRRIVCEHHRRVEERA